MKQEGHGDALHVLMYGNDFVGTIILIEMTTEDDDEQITGIFRRTGSNI